MTHAPDDQQSVDLDGALRSLLGEPDIETTRARDRSFARGAGRWRSEPGRTRTRRSAAPRVAAIAAAAASVLIAVALAPTWNDEGSPAPIPTLTPDATAAEALRWAGSVIVAEGDPAVGRGAVWHAVSVTTRDGDVVGANERWLSTADDTWEERHISTGSGPGVVDGARAHVEWRSAWVNSFDGTVQRGRGYRKPSASEPWEVPGHYLQSDVQGGMDVGAPMIGGPPPRVIARRIDGKQVPVDDPAPETSRIRPLYISATVTREEGTRRWIEAAASSEDSDDLKRATRIFLRTTRGHFMGLAADANPRARRTTTIKQLVHLLTIARSTPRAAKVLYTEFAQIEDLRRLPDVTIDGTPAMRIQYDFADLSGTREDELGGPEMRRSILRDTETVLVVDLETGAPLRTKSLDRTLWTDMLPATRVRAVGDDDVICREYFDGAVPCGALEGRGPLAQEAERQATSLRGRQFAEQYGGGDIRNQPNYASIVGELREMALDDDGLPLDDPDEPLGYARSQWGQRIAIYPLAPLQPD